MTVYVDDMYKLPMGRLGRMKMSHMMADTEAELHAKAHAIGVARKHYQNDHYDISLSKRLLAVQLGAEEITVRAMAAFRKQKYRRDEIPEKSHALPQP